jgi:hypothetical protein
MPPPGVKIKFDANVGAMRKSFREMGKLQKKSQKTRAQTMRAEKKHATTEMKRIKDTHKLKDKSATKEMDQLRKKQRAQDAYNRKEKTHRDSQGRFTKNQNRENLRSTRRLNREMKRGPLGRMVGKVGKMGMFAGGGLLGFAIGAVLKGYQNRQSVKSAMGDFIGMGGMAGGKGNNAWNIAGKGGSRYGYNYAQRAGLVRPMATATGSMNIAPLMQGSRGTGMTDIRCAEAGRIGFRGQDHHVPGWQGEGHQRHGQPGQESLRADDRWRHVLGSRESASP